MRTGNRWLITGLTGVSLLLPGVAWAQPPGFETPGVTPGGLGRANTGPQGSFQAPEPIRPGQTISVLVFPFGYAGEEAAPVAPAEPPAGADSAAAAPKLSAAQEDMSNYATASVKAGLLSSPFYTVATYHPQSSLIQRGRKDDILRQEHVTDVIAPATGAVNAEKAKVIAYRLGMQAYMIGTLELSEDAQTNTVEVTLETQLIDSTTGQVLRSAAVTGAAVGAEGVPIATIRERAALDAAQKALPALGIQLQPLPTATPGNGKGKGKAAPAAKSSKKLTPEEKKAERAARKEAEAAEKDRQREAQRAKREAEKAKRDAEKAERAEKRGETTTVSIQRDQVLAAQPGAGQPTPPAQPGAAVEAPTAAPNSVPGFTNAAGQPIPYYYAQGETTEAAPKKGKKSFKIPAWLGVAGFLTGLSFLL